MTNFNFPSLRRFVEIVFCALLACNSLRVVNSIPLSSPPPSNGTTIAQVLPVSESDQAQFQLWVKYASAAYCDVTSWSCGSACKGPTAGTQLVKFFNTTANKVYVALNQNQNAIIVAFRGTEDLASLLTDGKFKYTDYPGVPGAQVHEGFLGNYNSTRNQLNALIKDLVANNPGYQVILTGHSLGGAMTIFQMLDLVGTPGITPDNLLTYNYGQPRIGNQIFAQFLAQNAAVYKVFRVVNNNDIVPHVPPTTLLGFLHGTSEYWITNGTMVECTQPEDDRCSNSFGDNFSLLPHFDYLDTPFVISCLVA